MKQEKEIKAGYLNTEFGSDHTWHGLFINHLIKRLNFSSYLELGIAAGTTWKQIKCPVKIGVDIEHVDIGNFFPDDTVHKFSGTTTDDFFASLDTNKKIDTIFIDALHEKKQVKADFFNSINILSNKGIVILHDINPQDETGIKACNSGDAFAFWLELCDNSGNCCYTFKRPRDPSQPGTFEDGRFHAYNDVSYEDTVGIYIPNKELGSLLKKNYQHNLDHSFMFFNEHRNKYIEDRQVDFETLIGLIKNK